MNLSYLKALKGVNKNEYFIWRCIFFLYAFGFLINEMCKRYSFYPIATVLRLILIGILYGYVIRKRFIISRNLCFLLGGICLLTCYYLFLSLCDGEFLVGVQLYRYYLEPIILLLLLLIYLDNGADSSVLCLYFFTNILFAGFVSLLFYFVFLTDNISLFISPDIPKQFFLPGGVILRSYLPIGGPNELGLLFMVGIALASMQQKISSWTPTFLFLCLLLTVSKSSLLSLLCYSLLGVFTFKLRNVLIGFVAIVIFIMLFFSIDYYYLDSLLYLYFENLFSGNDPSTGGHSSSLIEAVDNFSNYYLWGYPTGTVGPRVETIYNVESSFFLLCYDKGLFFAFFFLLIIGIGLCNRIKSYHQKIFVFTICIALSVLPTVQSVEVFSLVLISPLFLKKCVK